MGPACTCMMHVNRDGFQKKNSLFNYFCSKPEYAAKKTRCDDQTEAVSMSMCNTITSTGSENEVVDSLMKHWKL